MGKAFNMVRLLFVISAVMFFFSCSKKIHTVTKTVVKDSIIVKEVPRLVEVEVPGETVTVTEYIECDSITNKPKPKSFTSKSGRAKVDVQLKADGALTATGGCDSLKTAIEVRDKEITRLRSEKTETKETVPVYLTRNIDKFCRWFTGIGILLIGVGIFLKIKSYVRI